MKEIIISTQAELDNLPNNFSEFTLILIKGGTFGNKIIIRVARENSSVVARGNSSVEARENSSVVASGNSSVEASGNSSVVASGNSSVVAWGNSSVEASGNSSVVAWENSSVEARGNSSVEAWGNSSVVAWENSSVEARENSSVEAWENSSIKIYSEYCNIKKAMMESVIIYVGVKGEPKLKDDTASIIYKNIASWTHDKFCQLYEKQIIDDYIVLYKSVNPETECDFYTGKIKYKNNKLVKCPDWNADETIECGQGLHLSPTPQLAMIYNKGKIKICHVPLKDFVVFKDNITKVRCKAVKVIGDYKKTGKTIRR
jgi:hypothetical protein